MGIGDWAICLPYLSFKTNNKNGLSSSAFIFDGKLVLISVNSLFGIFHLFHIYQ